jgi:hypothetical protein
LLRPLPVPHAERLAIIGVNYSDTDSSNYGLNAPLVRTLEKHHEIFQYLAASFNTNLQVHSTSGNQQIPGLMASGHFFQPLEVPPLRGRYLTPADDQERAAPWDLLPSSASRSGTPGSTAHPMLLVAS